MAFWLTLLFKTGGVNCLYVDLRSVNSRIFDPLFVKG